jgi:hypothetical protein
MDPLGHLGYHAPGHRAAPIMADEGGSALWKAVPQKDERSVGWAGVAHVQASAVRLDRLRWPVGHGPDRLRSGVTRWPVTLIHSLADNEVCFGGHSAVVSQIC